MSISNEKIKDFINIKDVLKTGLQKNIIINTLNKYIPIRNYSNEHNYNYNKELANNICAVQLKGDWSFTGNMEYRDLDPTTNIQCSRNPDQIEYEILKNSTDLNPIRKFCDTTKSPSDINACSCMDTVSRKIHNNMMSRINNRLNKAGKIINDIRDSIEFKNSIEWNKNRMNEFTRMQNEIIWSDCKTPLGNSNKDGWCVEKYGNGWKQSGDASNKDCPSGKTRTQCIRLADKINVDMSTWINTNPEPGEYNKIKNTKKADLITETRFSDCKMQSNGNKDGWCTSKHGPGWKQIGNVTSNGCYIGLRRAQCNRTSDKIESDLEIFLKENPNKDKERINFNTDLLKYDVNCCSGACNVLYAGKTCAEVCSKI